MPCPPEGVRPVLDCFTNTARVDWQAKGGADFYIVQASGLEDHESGCETATQSCSLTELTCGVTYNISVTAANSVCNSSQSVTTQLKAGEDGRSHMLTFTYRIEIHERQLNSANFKFLNNIISCTSVTEIS